MSRYTPCDHGECPFSLPGDYVDCRYHCGLGVDEDSDPADEFEDFDDPDDFLQNMPCDNSGICAGTSCSQYIKCHA